MIMVEPVITRPGGETWKEKEPIGGGLAHDHAVDGVLELSQNGIRGILARSVLGEGSLSEEE